MKLARKPDEKSFISRSVEIPIQGGHLEGELKIPANSPGIVLFAHGSGSSRHSPRNQYVARIIRQAGVGTMLFDLLTGPEEREDDVTAALRFDIPFLVERLIAATEWVAHESDLERLKLGYFGSSTGGAAALVAAATLGNKINAVVSRGGRPDLAGVALPKVTSPTLLIVGGDDYQVLALNEHAFARLKCEKELKVIPNATHLFEEPGALEEVARLAAQWLDRNLRDHPEKDRHDG